MGEWVHRLRVAVALPGLVHHRLFKAWSLLDGGKTGRALNEATRVLDRHRSLDGELLAEMERFADEVRARGSPYERMRADDLAARARSISNKAAASRAVFMRESGVAGVDAAAAAALVERLGGGVGQQTIERMGRPEFVKQAQAAEIDREVARSLYERLQTLSQTTGPHPPAPVPASAKVALALASALTVGSLGTLLLARVTFGGCSISASSGLIDMSVRSGMVVVALDAAAAVSFGIGIGLIAFRGSAGSPRDGVQASQWRVTLRAFAGLGRVIVGVVVALVATFFAFGFLTVVNGAFGHLICRPEAARPQGVTITYPAPTNASCPVSNPQS